MAKHLTDSELERYRERTLPPQALLSANAHLFDCEACHVRYGGDSQLGAAFDFARSIEVSGAEEAHPSFERLAAYVDDALGEDERLTTAAHLRECEDCEAQVSDLMPLRDLIAPSVKAAAPKVVAPRIVAPEPTTVRRPALSEKLWAVWQVPAYRVAATALFVTLFVALSAWVLTRLPRTDVADRRPQAPSPAPEQLQPPPDANAANTSPQPSSIRESAPTSSRDAPQVLLALDDAGGRVTLDAGGRVGGLDSLSPEQRALVGRVLTTARVETPRVPWADGRAGDTLLGGGESSFSLLGPVGKVVRDSRPTLRWTPLGGDAGYVVTVRDSQGRTAATSGTISSTEWSVTRPLRRGEVYSWQVLAVKDGAEAVSPPPNAPDARFKVLEETAEDELGRAEQLRPRSRLLLGALYARAGMLDEAEREFRELVNDNPRSSVARKLLRGVRARRR